MAKKMILKELSRYQVGTYADIVYRNGLLYSDEVAFKYAQHKVTFGEFNARVNALIHELLSLGVKKGDVLGILSWNCLEYADVYGAAMKGGFIISPFNPRLLVEDLDYVINYSQAQVLFVGPEMVDVVNSLRPRLSRVRNFISVEGSAPAMICYRDLLSLRPQEEPDVQVEEDDPLFIFYTSGTTGVPRGALYTHRRAMDDTRRSVVGLSLEKEDKQVQVMPLFHVGGAKTFWSYFFLGGSNVILPQRSFDPAATLQAIQDERATDVHIVPTHLAGFLSVPQIDLYNLSSLKRMFYAASPMPFELLKKGIEKWGPIFIQVYGATENGPYVTILSRKQHNVLNCPPEEQKVLTSAGIPQIGVHVRIVDERGDDVGPDGVGEIIVHSKAVMQEYWLKPEETRRALINGWVHTGDMGRYDEKGYIYIVDRKSDMIISGGENIYPREVEEALYAHPAVHEAAVIGIPDNYWVEKVHAVVVLKKGGRATADEIIEFCKKRLARYKAPKSVEFLEALPKNAAGKIMKRELKQKYWAGLERKA